MKNERLKLGLTGVCLLVIPFIIMLFLQTNVIITEVEAPCVDGHGDVNLEGIMCEKTILHFFDHQLDKSDEGFLTIFSILIAILILLGIVMLICFFTYNIGGAKNG